MRADECRLRFDWLVLTLGFHGLLGAVCLALQVRLFVFVRGYIRLHSAAPTSTANTIEEGGSWTAGAGTAAANQQQQELLELRAARFLTLGILPFCLISLPLSLIGVANYFVRQMMPEADPEKQVAGNWLNGIMMGLRELILFHLFYIPVVLLVKKRQFRTSGLPTADAAAAGFGGVMRPSPLLPPCHCARDRCAHRRRPRPKIYRLSRMPAVTAGANVAMAKRKEVEEENQL